MLVDWQFLGELDDSVADESITLLDSSAEGYFFSDVGADGTVQFDVDDVLSYMKKVRHRL